MQAESLVTSSLPALQLLQNEELVALETYYRVAGCCGYGGGLVVEDQNSATVKPSVFQTCQVPPGYFYNIDDEKLIAYDSYWDASKNLGEVKLADDHAQDTYFRKAELPLRDPFAFERKTLEPRATVEGHYSLGAHATSHMSTSNSLGSKGRFLAATQRLRVGETIAMDTSSLISINDPAIYKYFPGSNEKDGDRESSMPLLWRCCQHMMRKATQDVSDGTALLVQSSIVPMLCSLLLTLGDGNLLERGPIVIVGKSSSQLTHDKEGEGFTDFANSKSLQAQKLVNEILGDYCRHEFTVSENIDEAAAVQNDTLLAVVSQQKKKEDHLLLLAKMAIRCIPSLLLRVEKNNKYAFFSRLGLHEPRRMAEFIAALKSNAMSVQCPDLPNRTAFFPFLRFAEHECRPNAVISFIDSPASHTYGVSGLHNYNSATKKVTETNDVKLKNEKAVVKKQGTCTLLSSSIASYPISDLAWRPSVAVLTAIREIAPGEAISIAYLPTAYSPCSIRRSQLLSQYNFLCNCKWCIKEPDLARGFRCQHCPKNMGVVCPIGDGSKLTEWCCMHCGTRPSMDEINHMLDHERELQLTKADKHVGLAKLLADPYVHYTHSIVFKKIDEWSEKAWRQQDATMCTEYIDVLKKCVSRVLDNGDPSKAQLYEFSGQVQHALGNAHSARYEYFLAYQHRLKCGQRFVHWCRLTGYMANVKSLVDLLDSK